MTWTCVRYTFLSFLYCRMISKISLAVILFQDHGSYVFHGLLVLFFSLSSLVSRP
jgi:hypothetical protein